MKGYVCNLYFNCDRIEQLERIGKLCTLGSGDVIKSVVDSELAEYRQRNKLLKIADKHGWDTVREYAENPLADDKDDDSKLRSAISRAISARRFKPYQPAIGNSPQPFPGGYQTRPQQFRKQTPFRFNQGGDRPAGQRGPLGVFPSSQDFGPCFACRKYGHFVLMSRETLSPSMVAVQPQKQPEVAPGTETSHSKVEYELWTT